MVAEDGYTSKISKRGPPCPVLTDDADYDDWKNDDILQIGTEVAKEKWAATVYLNLEGKARRHCKGMKAADLTGDAGMANLTKKLDELFGKDENVAALLSYESFETFTRPDGMGINDYINEFESRYAKAAAKSLTVSDQVLAYRLLKNANLSRDKQLLARATASDLTLKSMNTKIKAIFDLADVNEKEDTGPAIKVETSLY